MSSSDIHLYKHGIAEGTVFGEVFPNLSLSLWLQIDLSFCPAFPVLLILASLLHHHHFSLSVGFFTWKMAMPILPLSVVVNVQRSVGLAQRSALSSPALPSFWWPLLLPSHSEAEEFIHMFHPVHLGDLS